MPVPSGSASPSPCPRALFALCIIQTLFQGRERGDGKRMLHPLLSRPTLGCSPAPLALCCRFQSEQGSDAKPHGAAEAGADSHCPRPHLPPGLWATCVLLLGVTGCCWLCQGAEPLLWGLSHRHRAQQWDLLWKGLPLTRHQRRENRVAAFFLLNDL